MAERTVSDQDISTLVEYLKKHARGPKYAKTRRQLEFLFVPDNPGVVDRLIRLVANEANQRGIPIATSQDGYFYADSYADFEPMLGRLRKQRDSMHDRIMAIERLRSKQFQRVPETLFGGLQ